MDHKDNNHCPSSLSPNPNSLRRRFALGFLRALMRIQHHHGSNSPRDSAKRRRRVKAAADAAMASAVGPTRVWSRAIIRRAHRRRLWFRRSSVTIRTSSSSSSSSCRRGGGGEMFAKENRRERVFASGVQEEKLRNLVPGGEDMETHKLLDETFDYIRCLTTQVQVMKRILDVYSSTT